MTFSVMLSSCFTCFQATAQTSELQRGLCAPLDFPHTCKGIIPCRNWKMTSRGGGEEVGGVREAGGLLFSWLPFMSGFLQRFGNSQHTSIQNQLRGKCSISGRPWLVVWGFLGGCYSITALRNTNFFVVQSTAALLLTSEVNVRALPGTIVLEDFQSPNANTHRVSDCPSPWYC